jgi:hypothetical protein
MLFMYVKDDTPMISHVIVLSRAGQSPIGVSLEMKLSPRRTGIPVTSFPGLLSRHLGVPALAAGGVAGNLQEPPGVSAGPYFLASKSAHG